jgi:hypothetical protein
LPSRPLLFSFSSLHHHFGSFGCRQDPLSFTTSGAILEDSSSGSSVTSSSTIDETNWWKAFLSFVFLTSLLLVFHCSLWLFFLSGSFGCRVKSIHTVCDFLLRHSSLSRHCIIIPVLSCFPPQGGYSHHQQYHQSLPRDGIRSSPQHCKQHSRRRTTSTTNMPTVIVPSPRHSEEALRLPPLNLLPRSTRTDCNNNSICKADPSNSDKPSFNGEFRSSNTRKRLKLHSFKLSIGIAP